MISLADFINEFSRDYSVQNFDDINSGIFVAKVKEDIYLMKNVDVRENAK